MDQIERFEAGRSNLDGKYAGKCQQDSDCASIPTDTTCERICHYGLKATLSEYAAGLAKLGDCSACALPQPGVPTCLTPICYIGTCLDGAPLN